MNNHAYQGLVIEHNGVLYHAYCFTGKTLLIPEFIPEDEIKNIFFIQYRFCFRGFDGTAFGTCNRESLSICIDEPLSDYKLEGLKHERYDQITTLIYMPFDDCDEVYVKKRQFKDYGIYGEEKETLKSYEELMNYVSITGPLKEYKL